VTLGVQASQERILKRIRLGFADEPSVVVMVLFEFLKFLLEEHQINFEFETKLIDQHQ
jgi:hypothetical protein